MAHAAGTPPHREDECSDCTCRRDDAGARPRASANGRLAPTVLSDDCPNQRDARVDRSMQAARADAARHRDSLPFVLQSGRSLLIVAGEELGWVVAELTFDPAACIFIEQSRAQFQWPREAFGRLLSRVYLADDQADEAIDRVTDAFQRWLALQFIA